jgi:hypothetical protein
VKVTFKTSLIRINLVSEGGTAETILSEDKDMVISEGGGWV